MCKNTRVLYNLIFCAIKLKIEIMKWLILTMFILTLDFSVMAQQGVENKVYTKQLKPAILYWDFGTLETIYQTKDSTGEYWNVIHRSIEPDKKTDGFDYYKMNGKTLMPILSELYSPGEMEYTIRFNSKNAIVSYKSTTDTLDYSIDIPEYVAPEGPGTLAFLGSLPLTVGYTIAYFELDRWGGEHQKMALVSTVLSVKSTDTLTIDSIIYNTYKVELSSENGANTTAWVLKEAPHYWLKVQYKPDKASKARESKVTKIVILH